MKEYLGTINEDIIEKWHLDEHRNKQIVFYYREDHCREHISQYANQNDYYYVMSNLKK